MTTSRALPAPGFLIDRTEENDKTVRAVWEKQES